MKNERILITAVRTKCWRQAKNKSAVTISYKPWFKPRFQTAKTGCLKNPFNAWRARCRASHLLIDLTDTAMPAGCSLATERVRGWGRHRAAASDHAGHRQTWQLCQWCQLATLHTRTHTRLTALCPGLPRWAGTRKVKTNLDFTEARDSEWH